MDNLLIEEQNIIKIFNNTFPINLEHLLFNVFPDKLEINGIDKTKSFFCQLILNENAFKEYNIKNTYIIPIINKKFNNIIKSISLKILNSPSMTMQFAEKDINITIVDSVNNNINIKKQIRSIGLIKNESFGIPNLPKFEEMPFCVIDNPEYLRLVNNSFSDISYIDLSIGNYSITFTSNDDIENNSEVKIKGKYYGEGKSRILLDSFKDASNVSDLKSINKSTITISKTGIVKFSYELENGIINYYMSKVDY